MAPEPASGHRFGNYEILSLLGRGGMAEVYRAKVLSGPRAGWPVAIKRLPPGLASDHAYVDRFTSEANLTRFLDHPNIVTVLEAGEVEGVYYMAMELVDGRDLGQILRRCRQRDIPLPVDFAVYLSKTILDALGYAHEAVGPSGDRLGIVHCDVSPSNVFISRTGEIKLGDFGIARAQTSSVYDTELLGKPYYLSPETLDGNVTVEGDLWSCAVILYELLTLERPFQGGTRDAVFTAIRGRLYQAAIELRPELSQELSDVVDRAFAEDVAERFADAADFAIALDPHYDDRLGTPLAIAAVVRGLFGASAEG
ncbi:MAG TPA: serine/threonine-protein kinase [Myxococcaceae bacterium]|jgi:serine/threonine-protein kinase